MAFTIAHMAAVLPFYRSNSKNHSLRWLQFDALLIGTMMPDFPYYIGSSGSVSNLSHEWLGVLTYCLPWGLLVFALWYWGLKPAAMGLIQPFMGKYVIDPYDPLYTNTNGNVQGRQSRIIGYANRYGLLTRLKKQLINWLSSFFLPVVLGLLIGAATHLIWDGITHADGFIARHIDWLQYRLYIYPLNGTSIARLLQYFSSLVGLVALLWFVKLGLQSWRYNNFRLVEQAILLNEMRPLLTKKLSLLIVSVIAILSLLWGLQLVLRWYPLLTTNPYTFAAKVSVSLLQFVAMLTIGYAICYHLIYFLRNRYLQHNRR